MTDHIDCPECKNKAELYAEVDPEGLIGCFCKNCRCGYITTNPMDGWDKIKITLEAIQDLQTMHGVVTQDVIIDIAMADRRNFGF